jgi:hypothetical protein
MGQPKARVFSPTRARAQHDVIRLGSARARRRASVGLRSQAIVPTQPSPKTGWHDVAHGQARGPKAHLAQLSRMYNCCSLPSNPSSPSPPLSPHHPLLPAIPCPAPLMPLSPPASSPPTLAGLYPCLSAVVPSSSTVSSSPSPEIPAHGGIAGRDATGGTPQQPPPLPRELARRAPTPRRPHLVQGRLGGRAPPPPAPATSACRPLPPASRLLPRSSPTAAPSHRAAGWHDPNGPSGQLSCLRLVLGHKFSP